MGRKAAPIVHIMDTDRAVIDGLKTLLAAHGYLVRSHSDSAALFRCVERHGGSCVVLDMAIPDGGMKVLHRLRERGVTIPVIATACDGSIPAAVEAIRAGATDYIEKPFGLSVLVGRIERALLRV